MKRDELCLIALRRIMRTTELFGKEFTRTAGVTAVQFRVLQTISEYEQVTGKYIADTLRVSQATVTALIDKLQCKGLVVREKSKVDKRRTDIALTEEGMQTLRYAPDPLHQKFVRKFEALEDWEQAMLVASLERVATMIDAEDLDAAPLFDTGDIQKIN